MKTLKKTLCLVLAVVMVVGALVLPASAAYNDKDKIATAYTTAVNSLTEWKVMEGDNAGNFKPEASIQRQEMAAIVYRLLTGDVKDKDGKDNSAIYAPYAAKFTDVDTTGWAAGYIGFCANKGIVLGTNDAQTTFEPARAIPANDVLAMLLRCLGYTQKDEFTGANWSDKVAALASRLGLTKGITRTLDKESQRQEVAQMTYQAAYTAPRVTWSDSEQDYIPYIDPNQPGSDKNLTLIKVTDGKATDPTQDQWGAPTGGSAAGKTVTFTYPAYKAELAIAGAATYAAKYESYTAISQCDLAKTLNLSKVTSMIVYTNGIENKTTTSIDPLNTTAQIGAQGRYTAVYENPDATTKTASPYIIVYKDTLLAKVTNVVAHTDDAQGHLKTTAKLSLDVYDGKDGSVSDTDVTPVVLENKTDYTWTKGQYLLVNYHQNNGAYTVSSDVRADATTTDYNKDTYHNDNVVIIQEAKAFNGAQTLISYNSNKHTIENVAYPDNNRYVLDAAQDTMKVPFTWFQDTQGNVIGSVVISTSSTYGVITRIWASINSADGSTTVKANVTYVDGTTQTVDVAKVSYVDNNAATPITAVTGLQTGVATYTDSNVNVMKAASGVFYVSDSYNTNWAADNDDANGKGIILDHLFKITASTDPNYAGAYDFVEVAGKNNTYAPVKGLANANTSITSGVATNGDVQVDNDTVFMIRIYDAATNAYTFSFVTGYKTVTDFVTGEVDYVNCDDDAAAEYVYILAGTKGSEGWHLFYAASTATSDDTENKALVQVDNNGKTYTVYGYLDGVAGSVTIAQGQKGYKAGDNAEKPDTWTGANLTTAFGKDMSGNTLWMVYIKDGKVVDVNGSMTQDGIAGNPVNGRGTNYAAGVRFDNTTAGKTDYGMLNDTEPYGNTVDSLGIYAKQSVMVVTLSATTDVPATSGGTITLGGKTFTLADPIVGAWADLQNVGKTGTNGKAITYTVIVVYDEKGTITQAYIYNPDAGTAYDPGKAPADPTKATVNYTLKIVAPNSGTVVGTYTYKGEYTLANSPLKPGLTALANHMNVANASDLVVVGAWTVDGKPFDTSVGFTLELGKTYAVEVTAYYKVTA